MHLFESVAVIKPYFCSMSRHYHWQCSYNRALSRLQYGFYAARKEGNARLCGAYWSLIVTLYFLWLLGDSGC